MYFPISGVDIPIIYLIVIGFTVGVCGGFWGIGGGWMVTPALFILGMPMHFAVGTDLAHIVGKSIVSTFRHAKFGNVDVRVALVMAAGTMVGVEVGATLIEYLEKIGQVDKVVSIIYVVFLGSLATFTFVESLSAKKKLKQRGIEAEGKIIDVVTADIAEKIQKIKIKPMIACPRSGIKSISAPFIVLIGLITGILAGFLGVGGGFIRMPLLVYLVGMPTHIAVGTDLLEIIITGSYGTFSHGLKQNVDIMVALIMLVGAAFGAQFGTFATRYVHGAQIRSLFSAGILVASISVALKLFGFVNMATILIFGMAIVICGIIMVYFVRGVLKDRAI